MIVQTTSKLIRYWYKLRTFIASVALLYGIWSNDWIVDKHLMQIGGCLTIWSFIDPAIASFSSAGPVVRVMT